MDCNKRLFDVRSDQPVGYPRVPSGSVGSMIPSMAVILEAVNMFERALEGFFESTVMAARRLKKE